jgi:hypothetical protein
LAAGQSDSHRAENREDAKERLPPPPPLISRRGCRAPTGSSPEKGQDAARTRAAKGQDHAAVIADVRARERPQQQPSHEASASARRVTRRQTAAAAALTAYHSKEDENALPCRACGF